MRTWCMPCLTGAAVVVGLVLAGCERRSSGPVEPMPIDGPNQVVIVVPGMT